MLILSRKAGETLLIGDSIEVTITEISGDKVRLGITAPKEVQILRGELRQVAEENRQAVQNVSSNALRQLAVQIRHE